MMLFALCLALFSVRGLVDALPTRGSWPGGADSNKRWYHDQDHPVHALFRRQSLDSFPTVGSPAWTALFPHPNNFPPTTLPAAWTNALNASIAAGKIPNIPLSTLGGPTGTIYPHPYSPTDPKICSGTVGCRAPGDLWDAPDGEVALAFDDGPLDPSPTLYNFLKSHNQHATHFFIGGNIYYNWQIFLQAYQDNEDSIAVHTYTHPYMTTLSNERVLAELGYTMQIIYDSTGGRVPKYWRPPYGDVDMRVRAIASQIFDLTTVVWNQDSADWELTYGEIPLTEVEASLKSFYRGKKSPGLIILEHELSNESVEAFIYSWPIMQANGWIPVTIPDASGDPTRSWYQNSLNDTSNVVPESILPGTNGTGTVAEKPTSASVQISSTSGISQIPGGGGGSRGGSTTTSSVTPSSAHTSKKNSATTIRYTMTITTFISIFMSAALGGFLSLVNL